MHSLFGTAALDPLEWLWPVGVGLGVFILVEIEKIFVRKDLHPLAASIRSRGKESQRQAGCDREQEKGEQEGGDEEKNRQGKSKTMSEKDEKAGKGEKAEKRREKSAEERQESPDERRDGHRGEDTRASKAGERGGGGVKSTETKKLLAEKDREIEEAEKKIALAENKIVEAELQAGKPGGDGKGGGQ